MSTVQASDTELAARLRLAVTRLARRLRQQSAEGMTPSQTSALASVERHGPLTPSELADVERVQRPTATRIAAVLLDAGLISKQADPADGRVAYLTITRSGRDTLHRARSRKTAYLARRLAGFDTAELQTLERAAELLERLIEEDPGR